MISNLTVLKSTSLRISHIASLRSSSLGLTFSSLAFSLPFAAFRPLKTKRSFSAYIRRKIEVIINKQMRLRKKYVIPVFSVGVFFVGVEAFSLVTFSFFFFLENTFGLVSLSSSALGRLDGAFFGVLFGGGLDLIVTVTFLVLAFPADCLFLVGVFELRLRYPTSSSDSFSDLLLSSLSEGSGTPFSSFSSSSVSSFSKVMGCLGLS